MLTVTTPLTVAPSVGLVIDAVSGATTLTVRVAVAVAPLPSRTVRPSVWLPNETLFAFQLNDAVVGVPEVVKIWAPSTVTVQVMVPVPLLSAMPTLTLPLSGVPGIGLVNHALSCDPAVARLTW